MNKIPSFTIDHERLLRGIYVSRKDKVGNETVTTFDIRMKEPNREPVVHVGAIHTIEHLAATYLRVKYLVLRLVTVETICFTTSLWHAGNHVNSLQKFWIRSQRII